MTKDSVEDVFLTHLEMEFPEFRQIQASMKGELVEHVHYITNVFFECVSAFLFLQQINRRRTQLRFLELLSLWLTERLGAFFFFTVNQLL